MGRSADDRKTEHSATAVLQAAGVLRPAQSVPQSLVEEAADYAHREGVPLATAIRIVGGATRRPYGTPKISPKIV